MAEPISVPAESRARVAADGGVDTGGRRAWVWCQDAATGHRFDVQATALPASGLTPIDGYPLNFKTAARPGKAREVWESDPTENVAAAPTSTAKPPRGGQA